MTSFFTRKRLLFGLGALVLVVMLALGFMPRPTEVEVVRPTLGPMQVVIEEEGVTEVRDRYTLSPATPGYLRRITLEVGDSVQAGQPVAVLEAPRAAALDPRTRAQHTAAVGAAQATLNQAVEQAAAAEAAAEAARAERSRAERLLELNSTTRQSVESAVAAERQAAAGLAAAREAVAAARAQLQLARAALGEGSGGGGVVETLRAPAPGRVLAVRRRSEGMAQPGEALLEIGAVGGALQVRADVLSQDAVRIAPGAPVEIDQWGGSAPLDARVERIEPVGRTTVSSLGVEEQRVGVVAAITSPVDQWGRLGSGYRVLARFVVWQSPRVLQIPTGALFRQDDGWSVFAVEDGAARLRRVQIGHQTGLTTEITGGLKPEDEVIAHPPSDLAEGGRVRAR